MDDIYEIRRKNLELLVRKYGSATAFSKAIGKAPTMISSIRVSRRNLGEKMAREIEEAASLPSGYLDHDSHGKEDVLETYLIKIRELFAQFDFSSEELILLREYRLLNKEDKKIVRSLVSSLLKKDA